MLYEKKKEKKKTLLPYLTLMHIYFQEDCLWVLITHRAERWGDPQTWSTPSHGELDHSKPGARPTQLWLEIWIAPDRLHSHHPHREPGRAATTLPASKLKKKARERPERGCRRPGPGRERRSRRVLPELRVPSHAREQV